MNCKDEHLVLEVNQGCPRGFGFTLEQLYGYNEKDEEIFIPLNIANKTVEFMVKRAPYVTLPALIRKEITEEEDGNQGVITSGDNGQFTVQITEEDSKLLNPGEYALIINLIDKDTVTHLSGDGNNFGIYRVCYE